VRPRRRQSAHALRGPTRDRDRNPSGRPPCRRDDRPLRTRAPELRKPRHCRARRPRPAVRGRQPRASSRATSPSRAHRPVGVLAYGVLFGIRAGHDAFLSDGVQNVLGRPAMSFSAWADRETRLLGRRAEFRLGRDRHLQRVRQRARELPARVMPSFVNTLRRCHSTVRGLRISSAPISGLVRPSPARLAICDSWAASSSSVAAVRLRTVSPVASSSWRARSANPSAPIRLNVS
jgi:hypothetical protein